MHSFTLLITASTAFAAAIPVPASTEASSTLCTTISENLSSAFGWQLVGTTTSSSTLDQTCTKLQDNQLLKWGNLGLDLDQISRPVCQTTTSTSASDTLPKVVVANTQTFTTILSNAFDTETYGYLCDNLQYKRVAGFLLDDATIINSTCQLAGGRTPNPSPFSVPESAEKNVTAIAAYDDAQSKLYAYLYAAQAGSASDLSSLCSSASGKVQEYNALQLNGDCVADTICSVQEPISVDEGKKQLKKWTSTIFSTVLINSSGVQGYANTLCEKLDVSKLESVGIDGQAVKDAACIA